jgi:hypothetical protein
MWQPPAARAAGRLPCGAHHRPSCPVDLWPKQEYHELPLHPVLLTDPRFCSSSLLSTLSTTASLLSSSSPSVGYIGESLTVNSVPIDSIDARLAPWQHLPRRLTTSWPESAGGAALVEGGNFPLFRLMGRKAKTGQASSLAGCTVSLLMQSKVTVTFFFFHSD